MRILGAEPGSLPVWEILTPAALPEINCYGFTTAPSFMSFAAIEETAPVTSFLDEVPYPTTTISDRVVVSGNSWIVLFSWLAETLFSLYPI